ncbi:amidohydrolase [Temperatibacter marinus]|uniref:Amidohydrolase n=1 Tax=Temperatibacter marinus TaxID=1456591 RepID=A0AA52HB76_9PROT|nr:amidohydrolase [Temperatibacter marinus]WND03353.1 amidohydrolase [Temperatibacter marinus]
MSKLLSILTILWMSLTPLSLSAQEDQENLVYQPGSQQEMVSVEQADTVIWGGKIYTNEASAEVVEAVVIKEGRFLYVGTRAGAEAYVSAETHVIDLKGMAVYPGFVDAHAHLRGIGQREMELNLEGVMSISQLQEKLKDWRAQVATDTTVIMGRGWIETHWPEKRFPSRWDLDKVVSDVPVILFRADGHALVANSAALKAVGINKESAAPDGGAILKNAIGEPVGIFVDKAMYAFDLLTPKVTQEKMAAALLKGAEVYANYGWTGLHNMSVAWEELSIMEQLSDGEQLGIRVYNSINDTDMRFLLETGPRQSDNNKIQTRAVKMYMDGALGSRGAALLAPYSDANTTGLLLMKEEERMPMLEIALREGIQINTHAIGDKGNRLVLDWFEKALALVPSDERRYADPRWRIEHSQIVNPDDIPRFKQLDVIPSMQPSHAIGDLHFAPSRLGDERLQGAYAWKSLINSGVIIAGGSDAPVERGDPRIEFYAAVARKDMKGYSDSNWHPEEMVSRQEALKMFTLWPAYASFQEENLGSVAVGKWADLTGFHQDIMVIPEADILKVRPILTMVQGKIVFEALDQ